MATKVVIYGLSTEGYSLACKIALNGGEVQIIDESTPSAISIKQDIAKSYPSVQALKDDEHLMNGLNIQDGRVVHPSVKEALSS